MPSARAGLTTPACVEALIGAGATCCPAETMFLRAAGRRAASLLQGLHSTRQIPCLIRPCSPPSATSRLRAPRPNGRPFASLLVVKKLAHQDRVQRQPFLSVDLGDRTGSFACTIFGDSPAFEAIKAGGEGAVVRIEGKVDYYQGRLSPRPRARRCRDRSRAHLRTRCHRKSGRSRP
jgi:hypothetical protein